MIRRDSFFDLFDNVLSTVYGEPDGSGYTKKYPYHIHEDDEKYILEMSLPGFDKKEILMNVDNGVLTVEYENDEENSYWKKPFKKQFGLNNKVDVEKISAKMDKGILKIELPKTEVIKPKKLLIS